MTDSHGNSDPNPILSDFLDGFPSAVQQALSRNTRRVTYMRGSTIRLVGARPRPGLVQEGLVRAYVATATGREVTVTYARPGYPIGMISSFMTESPMGLEAVEDTTVLYFDPRQFENALATDLVVAHTVAAWMAGDIVGTTNTLLSFAFGSVRNRLAAHLFSIAKPEGDGRLAARVTQQQLADAIGSARQVVARALSDLVSEGIVRTSRGMVTIVDDHALRRDAAPL